MKLIYLGVLSDKNCPINIFRVLSDKKHNQLKYLKWLNSQTSKETVKLKKLQTAETVKWHKMQKVTELVQSAHMGKIHQEAKLVQIV